MTIKVGSPSALYCRRVSESGRVTYEPVAECWDSKTLPHGAWLVISRPGSVSTRPTTEVTVDLVAAAQEARETMILAMIARTKTSYSIADIADIGIAALVEAAKKREGK